MQDRFEHLKEHYLPRFWDKEHRVMVYPEFINDKISYQLLDPSVHAEVDVWFESMEYFLMRPDRFIPMRPTPWYDKKRNRIYESDILIESPNGHKATLKFDAEQGFYLSPDYETKALIDLICRNRIEIIGNIHTKGDSDE